jgi:acetylornithine deacetylase/succinyl-diaminopimelate desuccinylase-like protein
VHEVLRPADEPSVIAAAAEVVGRLTRLGEKVAAKADPLAGAESVFLGQIHGGEIFNQYPQQCWLEGTRRWLPGTKRTDVEAELHAVLAEVARATGTSMDVTFTLMRDAFSLDPADPFVEVFQGVHEAVSGSRLPVGAKPFCDDGNSFWALAGVPAITHGPRAGGAHTLNEWVSISDLERVALVYAVTAAVYCSGGA